MAAIPQETLQQLHSRIANGEESRVGEMLRQAGANARAMLDQPLERSGYTALLYAITQHVADSLVQVLLKYGAGVEVRGDDNETPLYAAAFNREVEHVRLLLAGGANPNSQNGRDRETPLHCAARFGFVSIAEALMKAKADPNSVNARGECALFIAAKANRFDMVYFLLSNDVPKHTPDRDGHSALYIASEKGHKHVVALLQAEKKALREVKLREEALQKAAPKPLPTNEDIASRLAQKAAEDEAEAAMLAEMERKAPPKAAKPITPVVATPPIEYEGEKKVRTHDPITGKALGPCRSLEEVGYSRPVELPPGVKMPYADPLPKIGGTKMMVGTGTGEKFQQPPDIAAGEMEGDGIEATGGILMPVVF